MRISVLETHWIYDDPNLSYWAVEVTTNRLLYHLWCKIQAWTQTIVYADCADVESNSKFTFTYIHNESIRIVFVHCSEDEKFNTNLMLARWTLKNCISERIKFMEYINILCLVCFRGVFHPKFSISELSNLTSLS